MFILFATEADLVFSLKKVFENVPFLTNKSASEYYLELVTRVLRFNFFVAFQFWARAVFEVFHFPAVDLDRNVTRNTGTLVNHQRH